MVAAISWRSSIASRMCSRRRSIMRCCRRIISSTGASSSTAKGGVSLAARRRSERTWISISPVARFGLTFSGRALDDLALGGDDVLGAQVLGHGEGVARGLRVHDELHEPRAVAQVDEDQPAVVAAAMDPAGDADLGAAARGGQVAGPGVAEGVGSRSVLHPAWRPLMTRATAAAADSTASCSPESMSRSCDAVRAHDGNVAGAGAICLLELALQRAPGELLLDGEPRGARLRGQGEGLDPAVLVGDEEVGDRRAAPAARRRPAASARGPRPSPCPGSAGRRAAR